MGKESEPIAPSLRRILWDGSPHIHLENLLPPGYFPRYATAKMYSTIRGPQIMQSIIWGTFYPYLASGDRTCIFPNINDGFSGRAPDLGACELDAPEVVYGPRTRSR
jgi:hypothetical protein